MQLGYSQYKQLIKRFLNQLKTNFDSNFLSAALFGSVARNEGKPESDIDILVVLESRNAKVGEMIIDILVDADTWPEKQTLFNKDIFGNISVISRSKEELVQNPLILLDIMDQGIILYDSNNLLKELFFKLSKRLKELGAKKIILPNGSWYWDLKPDWKPGEVVEVRL